MKTDKYGQIICEELDVVHALLTDPFRPLKNVIINEVPVFDSDLDYSYELDETTKELLAEIPDSFRLIENPTFIRHSMATETIEEFDERRSNTWFLPKEYQDFDIAQYVIDQCNNDDELQRVAEELLLYHQHDMFMTLRYMKYLVDTMRKHKIVWGVGRGSSVASFVLYIIGVHKINSLYYDLDIREFIK